MVTNIAYIAAAILILINIICGGIISGLYKNKGKFIALTLSALFTFVPLCFLFTETFTLDVIPWVRQVILFAEVLVVCLIAPIFLNKSTAALKALLVLSILIVAGTGFFAICVIGMPIYIDISGYSWGLNAAVYTGWLTGILCIPVIINTVLVIKE